MPPDAGPLSLTSVTMTTDGAAIDNPGPGGWAVLLEYGAVEKLLSGAGPEQTTNNQMELQAVIEGLKALKKPCAVTLRADSQYVLNGLKNLIDGVPLKKGMKNDAYWQELSLLIQPHTLTLEWVRGHAGDQRNERVDQAATTEAQTVLLNSSDYQERYEAIQKIIDSVQLTDAWVLAIYALPRFRGASWVLFTPTAVVEARIRHSSPAVAAWTALCDGLDAALDQEDVEDPVMLNVVTNSELLVHQGNGTWQIKHDDLIPLAAQFAESRQEFSEIAFLLSTVEQIQSLVSSD